MSPCRPYIYIYVVVGRGTPPFSALDGTSLLNPLNSFLKGPNSWRFSFVFFSLYLDTSRILIGIQARNRTTNLDPVTIQRRQQTRPSSSVSWLYIQQRVSTRPRPQWPWWDWFHYSRLSGRHVCPFPMWSNMISQYLLVIIRSGRSSFSSLFNCRGAWKWWYRLATKKREKVSPECQGESDEKGALCNTSGWQLSNFFYNNLHHKTFQMAFFFVRLAAAAPTGRERLVFFFLFYFLLRLLRLLV